MPSAHRKAGARARWSHPRQARRHATPRQDAHRCASLHSRGLHPEPPRGKRNPSCRGPGCFHTHARVRPGKASHPLLRPRLTGQSVDTAAGTHLRLPLTPTEASVPGAESRVAAVTPLAVLGGGRLVITHSGVLGEPLSVVLSAVGSAWDL